MFGSTSAFCVFVLFSFFFPRVLEKRGYCSLNSNRKCWLFCSKQCISVLFMDPQIPLFSNFFIKNGSHGTIYTFKNYFATMFSVFSFQFQQNKFYPNRPIELLSKVITFFFSRITNIHEESTLWRIVSSIRGSTHYKKHNRIVKHINLLIVKKYTRECASWSSHTLTMINLIQASPWSQVLFNLFKIHDRIRIKWLNFLLPITTKLNNLGGG